MASLVSLLVVLTTCLLLFPSTHQVQTSQTQLLLQVRRQLEYPKQLDSWEKVYDVCLTQPSPNIAVTCEKGAVTELKIIGDKLDRPVKFSGYDIPNWTLSKDFVMDSFVTTLTRLTTLRVLILVSLGLWGPLPDKIHRLFALEVLDMSSNFLYGSIPPKLSRITGLQTLTLDNNYYNGSIPDWLDSFSNLTVLQLQSNCFNGTIPDSISKIATLRALSLSSNNLSGTIPNLDNLNKLEMLDLRVNRLDSSLPSMPNGLVTMLLSNNSLTGEIPQPYVSLKKLQHLDLSYNFLTGAPPEGLFSLPNISYLNLRSNMLIGSLSDDLACGAQLGFVDLSMNRLFGDIPACLSLNSNSDKRTVKLEGNCLTGDPQNQHEPKYCGEGTMRQKSWKIIMTAVIGGICFIVFFFSILFFVICRRSCQRALSEQKLLQKPVSDNAASGFSSELLANARYISQSVKLGTQILPTYRVFSVEELKEATKNFARSSYIGEGSIGKLYKGRLENGTYVAIRCLALYKSYSIRNLKLRLDLLAKLRHPNLVCLLGHCIDSAADDADVSRVFLIYEFVPSGTLCSHLSENSLEKVIKWPDRLQVLIGIAKAVHFLHTGIIPGSANNRLKTSSVLLDEHFVGKLSDYGLSIITEEIYKRQGKGEDQPIQTNSSMEVARNLDDDDDDDVYSFGHIILEVLTGPKYGQEEFSNIDYLITSLSDNEDADQVLDPIVLATSSQESLSLVISIASKCLSPEASSRPSVEEVLWNLQYAAQVQGAADGELKSEVASQV